MPESCEKGNAMGICPSLLGKLSASDSNVVLTEVLVLLGFVKIDRGKQKAKKAYRGILKTYKTIQLQYNIKIKYILFKRLLLNKDLI